MVAVSRIEHCDDVAQLGGAKAHQIHTCLKHGVQVGIAQTKVFQGQCGQVLAPITHRIALCEEVSPGPVVIDEVQDINLLDIPTCLALIAKLHPGKIKTLKEFAPPVFNTIRVAEVLLINLIDVAGIGVAE